jgi:hypothetical protein
LILKQLEEKVEGRGSKEGLVEPTDLVWVEAWKG